MTEARYRAKVYSPNTKPVLYRVYDTVKACYPVHMAGGLHLKAYEDYAEAQGMAEALNAMLDKEPS